MRRELKDSTMWSNALRKDARTPKEELLTVDDLFERYRGLVPKRTIDYWRYTKKGPPFIKIGRRVLYPLAGVIAWERKRMIHSDLVNKPLPSRRPPSAHGHFDATMSRLRDDGAAAF